MFCDLVLLAQKFGSTWRDQTARSAPTLTDRQANPQTHSFTVLGLHTCDLVVIVTRLRHVPRTV